MQQGRRLVVHVRNYEFLPLMDVEDALTWAQTFADQLGVPMVDRTDAEALRAGVEKQIRSLETGIAAHREGNRSLYEVQAVEPPGVVWTHDGMCWRNIEMTRRAVRFGEMPPVKLSTIRAVFVDGRPRWGEAPGTARVHVATDVQTHVLYYAPVDPDEPSPELAYAMWFADRVREAAAAHEPASAEDVATALGVGRVPRDIMRAPEKLP